MPAKPCRVAAHYHRHVAPNIIDSLTSRDQHFAAAVALFGMILRNNNDLKDATLNDVLALAEPSVGPDPHGYRAEFVELVKKLSENELPR